ncbi:MAG TPA: thioesterase family protein [Candidatus Avacidaminococcus intestinavium]|uniref:Thioesterase family protein n=1 Tax=Candidatus Avacidaminococcus intestinavium TaxID=2840684 RepID=A0A9D1SLZ8_9FIRM|nr:thioesterase family protein [Candidatus Avacidaminococcus intestinavium]
MTDLRIGLTGTASETVLYTNTASALGSGLLDVYATPAMIALLEKAAVLAITPSLKAGEGSVGIKINVTHERASLPGQTIIATADLIKIDGRKLTFKVTAVDEHGLIGQGEHERFIINDEKFLANLKK